jgi:hypothetical protein
MTPSPKEKAEELVKLFYYTSLKWALKHAKECATKCVDEIIKSNPSISVIEDDYNEIHMLDTDYWQQVKKEIEQL